MAQSTTAPTPSRRPVSRGCRPAGRGRGFAGCGALAGEWDGAPLGSGSGKTGGVAGDGALLLMGVPPVARVGHGSGQRRHAVVRYAATLAGERAVEGDVMAVGPSRIKSV